MFSMTLHELTACVYYKLAVERGLRGCNPDAEYIAHLPHSMPPPQKPPLGLSQRQPPQSLQSLQSRVATSLARGGAGAVRGQQALLPAATAAGGSSGAGAKPVPADKTSGGGGAVEATESLEYESKDLCEEDLEKAIK
jgi:hypothetical protein